MSSEETNPKATCWICPSDKYVDSHHLDCLKGKLSPETVPLCRRCHVTYHAWGIGAFSPDTTEKAMEVENKRREILWSLPAGHPSYRNLPPMKSEDVRRSRYWYLKHHISPPPRLGRKKPSRGKTVGVLSDPLCGEDWLKTHLGDHTFEEIEALSIEIAHDNSWLSPVSVADKRGTVKMMIKRLERGLK